MKHTRRITSVLLLALATSAASSAAQIAVTSPDPRSQVTARELRESPRTNLYDFVSAHRPLWLNTRGPDGVGSPGVIVYVDGVRLGGVQELAGIPTAIVSQVTHLGASEATLRWGAGHSDGVILVTTGPAEAVSGEEAARG